MPKFDIASIWRNVKELDLQPIRAAAERQVWIAIVGATGSGRHTLADQLRTDPRRPEVQTFTPVAILDLAHAAEARTADLILLVVDVSQPDLAAEQQALTDYLAGGQRAIVLHNKIDLLPQGDTVIPSLVGRAPLAFASATDWAQLQRELAPKIAAALPGLSLALGRSFPMLRETVARNLINETSSANAAYSFSTGLAELIPILDIPLNIADIIVLTKAQAILVYKLGLAFGMSTDWQYYLTEFSGVIGGGFLWRQVARSLVGLIPAWGIVPKVAVAYSGTYAVGQAVVVWYLTGRHATRKMLRGFSQQAFERGKSIGRTLTKGVRRPRGTQTPALSSGGTRVCPHCGVSNDEDAKFCKACGQPLGEQELS